MDCSHCGFPIHGSASGLRHYGTHIAHQENECLRLLMADRDRLRAAEVQRLREALKPFAAIDLTTNQAVDAMDVLRARRALEGGE